MSQIKNANEFYGIISGKQSAAFAQALNNSLETSQIVSVWNDISEFQKNVGNNAKEEIKGLSAILVTDFAFPSKDVSANVFAFNFMQSMFKAKELFGLHIILFTKDQDLYEALQTYYTDDPDAKYDGTKVLLNPTDYSVPAIKGVFSSPFNLLSYSDKKKREMEKLLEEAREKEHRVMSRRGYLMLLGKQQALQEMMDMTQRELVVVNRKLIEYATSIQDDNLENIVDDLETDVVEDAKDLLKREYEKLR